MTKKKSLQTTTTTQNQDIF